MLQSSNSIIVSRIEFCRLPNCFDMKSLLLATCLLLAVVSARVCQFVTIFVLLCSPYVLVTVVTILGFITLYGHWNETRRGSWQGSPVHQSTIQGDFVDIYLEKAKDQVIKCGKENGLQGETARQIFEEDLKTGVDKATCTRACCMKLLGLMKDSKVNLEKMNEFIKSVHSEQPEVIKESTKRAAVCASKVKDISDECKMAYVYVECYLTQ